METQLVATHPLRCNIAVFDAGGNLIAHVRQDGARIGSIDISIHGVDLRGIRHSDQGLGENSQPTQQFFGIHTANGGDVAISAGGVPLTRHSVIIDGRGVSGGSGEQDHRVALVGQAAL